MYGIPNAKPAAHRLRAHQWQVYFWMDFARGPDLMACWVQDRKFLDRQAAIQYMERQSVLHDTAHKIIRIRRKS